MRSLRSAGAICAIMVAIGCADPEERATVTASASPPDPTLAIKRYVDARVADLARAVDAMCTAAPVPDADGWSITADRVRVMRMRAHWREARRAYERVEGAIAILFPELDLAIDGRYEHTVELGSDRAPFDEHGFIGMHAVERILWSDSIREEVDAFERELPGYVPPATPANEADARAFVDGLCARSRADVHRMARELAPLALDPQTAWRGIEGSIEEQAEKVRLAATGQDESRYAQTTLADMRANLEGGRAILEAYAPRMEATPAAHGPRAQIEARMRELEQAYDAIDGDALPPVPVGFDPDHVRMHGATPYGRLFALLANASDPRAEGSLAAELRAAGEAMGIAPLGR